MSIGRCLYCIFKLTATTESYTYGHTLSLHDALPICTRRRDDGEGKIEVPVGQLGLRIALSLRCVEALINRHAAGRLARGVDHVVVQEQHGAELDDAEEQHQEDRQQDGELHGGGAAACALPPVRPPLPGPGRSEEPTSELQSLMSISYAVYR